MFNFGKKKKKQEVKESRTGRTIVYSVGQPVSKNANEKEISKEAYQKNVIAFQCVNLIARAASSIDFNYYDQAGKKVDNSPLIRLIENPNETQSTQEFFESLYSFQLIHGNSYIELKPTGNSATNYGEPVYLYSHRPDRFHIKPGFNGLPSCYEYRGSNGMEVDFPVSRVGKSNIIHVRTFNPLNDWYGMSPITAAAYSIDQHNESSTWNLALLQNGARPSGALQCDNGDDDALSDEQFSHLKTQLNDQYQGSKNAGRPLILEGGLKWVEMSLNPKDMDYINSKNTSARDIALAFGVPPQLLGIEGDSTYNTMAEARLDLWEKTIIPLAEKFTTKLNTRLAPRFDDGVYMKVNKESIDALSIKRAAKAESLEKLTYVTINEKRQQIGLEPIDGGDSLPNIQVDLPELSKQQYYNSIVKNGCEPDEAKKITKIVYAD